MNIVIVVKQGDQKQNYKHELHVDKPLIIGRSWQSDVVIDDQYIEGSHIQVAINESNEIYIEDLNTQNGTRISKALIANSVYRFGDKINIGDSTIVLFDAEAAVESALPLDAAHAFSSKFNSLNKKLIATMAALLALLFSLFVTSAQENTADTTLTLVFGFAVVAFIWSLLAGFVSKLFRHETNVSLHWVLVSLLSAGAVVFGFFLDIILFNWDSELVSNIAEIVFFGLFIAIFVYGTLSLATRFSKPRKLMFCAVMALLPILITFLSPMLKEKHELWINHTELEKLTLPTGLLFRKPTTLDKHIDNTEDIFNKLAKEVDEES